MADNQNLFAVGGIYTNRAAGRAYFAFIAHDGTTLVYTDWRQAYRQCRHRGHVYRLSGTLWNARLCVASELAESIGIGAPEELEVRDTWRQGIVDALLENS